MEASRASKAPGPVSPARGASRKAGCSSGPPRGGPGAGGLRALPAHKSSLAVYLSANDPEGLKRELLSAGLDPHTPVGVAFVLGWPDEQTFFSTIDSLPRDVHAHGITRQAVFLILPHLDAATRSRLYAPDFAHGFRP